LKNFIHAGIDYFLSGNECKIILIEHPFLSGDRGVGQRSGDGGTVDFRGLPPAGMTGITLRYAGHHGAVGQVSVSQDFRPVFGSEFTCFSGVTGTD
jgi:hypothetical protein